MTTVNPNSALHWLDAAQKATEALDVETPTTTVVEFDFFESLPLLEAETPEQFPDDELAAAACEIGWPVFLRTDLTSAKHDGIDAVRATNKDDILPVASNLGENRTVSDVEVEDISPRDDGIPWRPDELVEEISRVSFSEWTTPQDGPGHLWGPENIVTIFMSYGPKMDITEIVQYDGSLDPRKLRRARKEYQEFVTKMKKTDYNRLSFKDYVSDDN